MRILIPPLGPFQGEALGTFLLRCTATHRSLLRAVAAGLLGSASLGSRPLAALTRNASPPHVTDENPDRETQDKNGIDRYIKHCSALHSWQCAHSANP
jgi:hypothetical protein